MVIEGDSSSTENVVSNNGVDLSSPLYMHPSDNPGVSLVQIPFDGVGYRSWRRSVLRVLSVKNKLGFINGDCKRPDPGTSQFRQWGRCDDMVTSWILNSLAKEIAESVEYVSDSFELWKELEDRYDQTNGAKLYQIQREINELSHGNLDITTYYTKMKRLWEELSTLHIRTQCNCNCTCGAKDSVFKAEQDRRLIQFLMGLNEVYTVIRGNILMMNPLPSLAQTFSLLVQDEKQREIKPNAQVFMESAALNAGNSGKKVMESVAFNANGSAGASTSRTRIICDYCKRPGHIRDKCYKLHGYPQTNNNPQTNNYPNFNNQNGYRDRSNNQNSRFNRGKSLMADVQSGCCSGEEVHRGNHNDTGPQLTREQYTQFVELLQQFQTEKDNANQMDFAGGNANFAGASNHMTFDITFLTNITYLPCPLLITLPNGYKVKVVQIGNVAPSMKRPLVIGEAKDGLYFLCSKCPGASCAASTTSTTGCLSSQDVFNSNQ
ncbi:hypothetical protein KY290_038107 [Solanum tuberosum]|uniref:Retrotransposon Copia-like N-terminal domain-containing protein n=1 Tax=Solanum tuberosum TaxID=4113 RepID=A0ABQ7TXH6_SOLTU|nr:hypothetical protein KY284_037427 [Solanum tuberosum]KAH0638236.1 hypothetical protein KY289_038151 [Solanum tuberosum]KAH0739402.1 hypothetical protein KY290_038107 [Solanum tuberosum]